MGKSKSFKTKNSAGVEEIHEFAVDAKNVEENIFSIASTRSDINSKDSLPTIFGKIKKWYSCFAALVWTGSWKDLADKPGIGDLSGTLGVSKGGTGATTPSQARVNLGVGASGTQSVANNCTTTAAGSVLDARQGKVLMDKANKISSDLSSCKLITEGSGADTKYFVQLGADAASKKELANVIDYVYPGIPNKTIEITGNTKDTLYVIIVCYASGGSDTALSRTPITACTGADYELITQHKNPKNTGYAFALYRLTNAGSSISISALASSYGGNFIVLG